MDGRLSGVRTRPSSEQPVPKQEKDGAHDGEHDGPQVEVVDAVAEAKRDGQEPSHNGACDAQQDGDDDATGVVTRCDRFRDDAGD